MGMESYRNIPCGALWILGLPLKISMGIPPLHILEESKHLLEHHVFTYFDSRFSESYRNLQDITSNSRIFPSLFFLSHVPNRPLEQ